MGSNPEPSAVKGTVLTTTQPCLCQPYIYYMSPVALVNYDWAESKNDNSSGICGIQWQTPSLTGPRL